jgi:E3 ubiquitin-protein ligase HERC2
MYSHDLYIFLGILLPELIVSLILLESEVNMFLTSVNWLNLFGETVKSLDKLCRLSPEVEAFDIDDISWRGVSQTRQTHHCHKSYDDLPLIRKADLDNHNMDGGLWVLVNNKVYDVQDFRSVAKRPCNRVTFMLQV